jgi:AraC-like DNA-binding protein
MPESTEWVTIRLGDLDAASGVVHACPHMNRAPRLPPVSDPLSEIMHSLHLTGALYCVAKLGEPWGIEAPQLDGLMTLQIVTAGQCWIEVDGAQPRLLGPGSMTLIPHGTPHRMRSSRDVATVPLFGLPVERISDRFETMRHGGDGAPCHITYGALRFDAEAARRLTSVLPPLIQLDGLEADTSGWIQSTLRLIAAEASELGPGAEIIITRIADVLVIQAIRSWLRHAPISEQGWVAAFNDELIGRALALVHHDPAAPWSVAGLARDVGMSRSAFSARFSGLVGVPVMSYVTDWRMQVARGRLRSSSDTVARVGASLGYQSEATFSRAYRRTFGVSPGSDRTPTADHDGSSEMMTAQSLR